MQCSIKVVNAIALANCHDLMFTRWKVETRAKKVVKGDSRLMTLVNSKLISCPPDTDRLRVIDSIEQLVRQLARATIAQKPWLDSVAKVTQGMVFMYENIVSTDGERYACFDSASWIQLYMELQLPRANNRGFYSRRIMQYVDNTSKEMADVLLAPAKNGCMRWLSSDVAAEAEIDAAAPEPGGDEVEVKDFLTGDFGDLDYRLLFDEHGNETPYGRSKRDDFGR